MAEVALIYLPPGQGGTKQGVDDYLAAGHSVDDLLALVTTELREPPRDEEEDGPPPVPYRATPHGLVFDKPTQNGPITTTLTNFTAKITGDVVEDDGAEQRRSFEMETELRGHRSSFSVPAEQFSTMKWPAEHLGAGAILSPGLGAKEHARAAIQTLSGDVPTRHRYAHTGWRRIGEEWVYLHAGGAVGPLGPLNDVEVSLGDGRLGDYVLPALPTGDSLVRALEASLQLLDLAPREITVPVLAAVFRAPLGEMVPVDLSVYLAGPTGVMKTEITAIGQAHYGAAFNGRNLPSNWISTPNAIEKQAFATKDVLLTIDDFAPTGTNYDVQRLHGTADRVLRAQGNGAGRSRMRADTALRAVYHPRGLILSSGEDLPRGQSLRSRVAVLEVSPGDVDLKVLTEMQRHAAQGLLASVMSAYTQWLASQMEDLKEKLPERHKQLRTKATEAEMHARTPDMVASLYMALEVLLRFAEESGAITDARARELSNEWWEALGEVAAPQAEYQAGEEPTRQFIELLVAAIASGDAYIADAKSGEEPQNADRWGWRSSAEGGLQARGRCIGWVKDDGSVLLEPGAAFAVAQDMARRQGGGFSLGMRTLWRRMAEKSLLSSRDDARGRNTTRATISGQRRDVVHLIADVLYSIGPNGPNDPPSGKGAVPSPLEVEMARENGLGPAGTGPSGPKGAVGPFPEDRHTKGVERDSPLRLLDVEAQLVDTQAGVQALLPKLRESDRVALDLETTGLDPREHRVRLFTLATERGTWLVDCFEVDPRPLFTVLADKKLLIHNAIFDLGFLSQMGFEMGEGCEVIDTMLASQVLAIHQAEDKEGV